ncbi:hypothetical protein [Aliihoeflea sp. 2WW]|uniref:hypothetical protein n=1 Tax=Aliihoeflea sp. 2WW TaxID=1381123 RepID=UPI0004ADAD1A|nr:hypothetical protein [Aliihoeflea sp. 2WW]
MNAAADRFSWFIKAMQVHAGALGLRWQFELDEKGHADALDIWDIETACDVPRTYKGRIRQWGADVKVVDILKHKLGAYDCNLHPAWTELFKATVIDWIAVRRNLPSTVQDRRLLPLRRLATCCPQVAPYDLSAEHVRQALAVFQSLGTNFRANFETTIADIFDGKGISRFSPILNIALDGKPRTSIVGSPPTIGGKVQIKDAALDDRWDVGKLPESKAFWELIRILGEEKPRSFTDSLRFCQTKILVMTGLRITEVCLLPHDCWVEHQHVWRDGLSMQDQGGVGTSYGLRYFVEKHQRKNQDSSVLQERVYPLPEHFRDELNETIEHAMRLTAPLRATLRRQYETKRLLPMYGVNQIVHVAEIFPILSGDLRVSAELPSDVVGQYREGWDVAFLGKLRQSQRTVEVKLSNNVRQYFYQFGLHAEGKHGQLFPARRADGSNWEGPVKWNEAYVIVGELEEAMKIAMPTKIPDQTPFSLGGGQLLPQHDLLFLQPSDALLEQRNNRVIDVERCFSVGPTSAQEIRRFLGGHRNNVFTRYGRGEGMEELSLSKTHSFRHLLNTEYFRDGVSDAIITKQFGRESVQQSYAYDHRSLREQLQKLSLPEDVASMLPAPAQESLKLILTGRISGRLVREFYHIHAKHGELAALEYLAAEASGFHATPYGYCGASFLVDPCPRHLECFNACRNLEKSSDPKHQENFLNIERQLQVAEKAILAKPSESVGWANQLKTTQQKLKNVRIAIDAAPGAQIFPEGPDRSSIAVSAAAAGILSDLEK